MGCLRCEQLNWDEPQPIVFTDAQAQSYCEFHAAVANKQLGTIQFNDLVFSRLAEVCKRAADGERGVKCDLSGTVFPGNIDFTRHLKNIRLPDVDLFEADFHGVTQFRGLKFGGATSFYCATFHDDVDLSAVKFFGKADFSSAEFDCRARFQTAKFYDEAMFSDAEFKDTVSMYRAIFNGNANFERAIFSGELFCSHVSFMSTATFVGAHFACGSDFQKTSFLEMATFTDVAVGNSENSRDLRNLKNGINVSGMKAISLRNLVLSTSELPFFCFRNCYWPDRFGLDTYGDGSGSSLLACEELYRAMKQRAAEEHDQPQVSRWHFREKLMQLKAKLNNYRSNDLLEIVEDREAKLTARAWAWFKLLALPPYLPKLTLTGIYWATSGFGERAVRAGVWLLALLGLSFLANAIPQPFDWSTLAGAAAANATMASIPFAKDIPGEGWVKVARGFWQFLIAVQFTLFALAVRNRFRR